ncbi:hypothetical protein FRB95_010449 [Tulasnella sp. JGI-2019a]|nr:hypothetical protein FRB95_010449 [Tulasnella sp. JGI-2019a]
METVPFCDRGVAAQDSYEEGRGDGDLDEDQRSTPIVKNKHLYPLPFRAIAAATYENAAKLEQQGLPEPASSYAGYILVGWVQSTGFLNSAPVCRPARDGITL